MSEKKTSSVWTGSVSIVLRSLVFLFWVVAGCSAEPLSVILDTDVDTDCDDAGALAIFHNLASAGKINPLGVVCSVSEQACADYVAAVNEYYQRSDLPIGLASTVLWKKNPSYERYRQHRARLGQMNMLYNEAIGRPAQTEDAVQLYRRLLAEQPEQSVTIVCVGTLTVLSALLESEPDRYSTLSGKELVASRVVQLVSMARASYPKGHDGFNWNMDFPAAAHVMEQWPSPVAVQESGKDVMTGAKMMADLPEDHPVARAYSLWLGNWQDGKNENRSSWDQLTLLYAVDGAGDRFLETTGQSLVLDRETGTHQWLASAEGPGRTHVKRLAASEALVAYVERWMSGCMQKDSSASSE